jgi:hypothetical protein
MKRIAAHCTKGVAPHVAKEPVVRAGAQRWLYGTLARLCHSSKQMRTLVQTKTHRVDIGPELNGQQDLPGDASLPPARQWGHKKVARWHRLYLN